MSQAAKILVLGPQWLGDCVMAEPSIRQLAAQDPQPEITLVLPEDLAPLFSEHPSIHKVESYPRGLGFFGRRGHFGKFKGFDTCLVLRNSVGSALDAQATGTAQRIGFQSFPRSLFLTQGPKLPSDFRKRHRSQSFSSLTQEAGAKGELSVPSIPVSDAVKDKARAKIEAEGGPWEGLLVAIHPGANYGPAKMWGEEKFAAFATRMVEDHNATIALLGGPKDKEVASAVAERIRPDSGPENFLRDLVGKTQDLAELAAIFALADLALGNDSGPIHLAAAVGTPAVSIFGSTSSDFTGIQGERVTNLWERLDCSPCFRRECPKEDYMKCMDAIPAARVYNSARELLGIEEEEFQPAKVPSDGEGEE